MVVETRKTPTGGGAGDALAVLGRLIEQAQAVRADIHAANRARRRDNIIGLVLVVVVVLLLGGLLQLSAQNSRISKENRQISRQIADCTTAGGQCYSRGQARTGEAVARLAAIELAVADCARDARIDSYAELEACVTRVLAEHPAR